MLVFRDSGHRFGTVLLLFGLLLFPLNRIEAQRSLGESSSVEFLRQLNRRGLFPLGEQLCREQLQQLAATESALVWQLNLSRTLEQHAWFEVAASRDGLMNQSIELINEYLDQESIEPEAEFQLRLQQISTMIAGVRMSLILNEAGHLTSRRPSIDKAASDALLPSITRGLELTETLEQQLERLRDDLTDDAGRQIRSNLRLQQAELHCLKWRLNVPAEEAQLALAQRLASTAMKNCLLPKQQQKAAWLLAELALLTGSPEDFQLRIQAAESYKVYGDLLDPAFLKVRQLLTEQETSRAKRELVNVQSASLINAACVRWLSLETALGELQLAQQLQDASLIESAISEFEKQRHDLQSLNGAFADAATGTLRRFQLLQEVGVEVADLIEQVEQQQAAGAIESALQLIQDSVRRLKPEGTERSRAVLLLRAAELQIAQQQWQAADEDLAAARGLFEALNAEGQLAVTDLLQIFVSAQVLRNETSSEQWQRYVDSLRTHVIQFQQQPTAATARTWLLQALESQHPAEAANVAMDLFETEPASQAQVTTLERAGELLTAATRLPTSSQDRLNRSDSRQVMERFQALLATLESRDRKSVDRTRLATMQLMGFEFQLWTCSQSSCDWRQLDTRLAELASPLLELQQQVASDVPPYVIQALRRWTLLEASVACRTTSDGRRLNEIRSRLLQFSAEQQKQAIAFLGRQFDSRTIQVGDVWLARTCDVLGKNLLPLTDKADRIELALWLLPRAVRCGAVTQETDFQETLLEALLTAELSEERLASVAQVLSSSQAAGRLSVQIILFWKRILQKHPSGSDLWLEASFQLARAEVAAGNKDAARRQLAIVQTLYPDWGNADRRSKADQLLNALKSE